MIPKARLDALTDGVFAFAMTLLVIDLRLPENFRPQDAAELLHHVAEMSGQLFVYAVSFYLLSLRWVGMVRLGPPEEQVSKPFTKWALIHLFLVTFVPVSTVIVARYAGLAPAVWIFSGNILLMAFVALRLAVLTKQGPESRIGLWMIILASLLAIGASVVVPKGAMLFYLVNLVDEPVRRVIRHRTKI
jgi:uncharacterized membrane protein